MPVFEVEIEEYRRSTIFIEAENGDLARQVGFELDIDHDDVDCDVTVVGGVRCTVEPPSGTMVWVGGASGRWVQW